MNKKLYITVGAAVVVLIFSALLYIMLSLSSKNISMDSNQPMETNKSYTKEEVANHVDANDCWTIIDNSVYNITEYINRHPGGIEILRACGQDATDLFNMRRSESGENIGTGSPHSPVANDQLRALKIGSLKK